MGMQKPAYEMNPLEYLKQADKEMAAGNGRIAAGLLSKAIEATLRELAKEQGLEITNLEETAKALEAAGAGEKYYFQGTLLTAQMLREHEDGEIMEDYELEGAYIVTRRFLIGCNGEL